ncbi:MAG TPA: MEKHLA domain-containing protein [Cytophagaceae bacterium]|jgi:hypothetical protein|nr:MEKHLA domain-containing protein [Cytophagaceae bacterium]
MSLNDHWKEPAVEKHSHLLVQSYVRICRKNFPLNTSVMPLPEALYKSEYILVSHGTEEDPIFNYANGSAQQLWRMDWETFTRLPSRLSAREDKVEKRKVALQQALSEGYLSGYEGIRIDATGKEFYIRDVTLWNVIDEAGLIHGQAALFKHWEYIK